MKEIVILNLIAITLAAAVIIPLAMADTSSKEKSTAKAVASVDSGQTPDEVLTSLTPIQRAVLTAIPDDRAVSADSLSALSYPYGDIVAALTILEIMGLIQKLPGALYTRV